MTTPHQQDDLLLRQIAEAMTRPPFDDADVERALDEAAHEPPLNDSRVRHIINLVHEKEPVMSAASRTAAPSSVTVATRRDGRSRRSPRHSATQESPHVAWLLGAVLLLSVALIAGSAFFGGGEGKERNEGGANTGALADASPTAESPAVRNTSYGPAASKMTPRARREVAVTKIAVGDTVTTSPGERRRVALADGSIVYINENTQVEVKHDRRVELVRGEVFVEVAHATDAETGRRRDFVVATPDREVTALGTKFAVAHDDEDTRVLVTQGKVAVGGVEQPLEAGQQLLLRGEDAGEQAQVTPAERASHLLAWTRDLLAAAESPLVPGSKHAGGALVAVDPYGEEAKLSLRKYHVDVHIEDGFARTTIDQTYFNHQTWRMEGTFYFPLPPDASLSRLAMYVGPKLMEGGMAEREHARNVFEQIVYRQRDPALLEWVDGSTFKMRVFPLEGRQEKRIIISYTQKLPGAYGRQQYRFPAGHNLEGVRDFSVKVRVKGGADLHWTSPSHELTASEDGGDLVLTGEQHHVNIDKDVVVTLQRGSSDDSSAPYFFQSSTLDGQRYFAVRLRPALPTASKRQRRNWVMLFENSGDRDPLLARVQVDVLRSLLDGAEHDDTFSIVTASTRAGVFSQRPLPCTAENIARATEFLDGVHLVGALDLGQAFAACRPLVNAGENSHLVHVGSGVPVLGKRQQKDVLELLPAGATYVGVGVGKRWNRALMKEAARRTGGYFTQINPDEPVSWRGFELISTLNASRLLDVNVTADSPWKFHTLADAVADGEEIVAVARAPKNVPLPKHVQVTGTMDGETYEVELPVDAVERDAGHLPRTWARQEIDRLVAEGAEANKQKIIELSKATYVMSPFTSLLVLESEEMYKQFHVDRGRKDHWAMYPAPAEIEVVYEPLGPAPPTPVSPEKEPADDDRPSIEQVLQTVNVRIPAKTLYWPNQYNPGYRVLNAWQLLSGAYAGGYSIYETFTDESLLISDETTILGLDRLETLRERRAGGRYWGWNDANWGIPLDLSTSLDLSGRFKNSSGYFAPTGQTPTFNLYRGSLTQGWARLPMEQSKELGQKMALPRLRELNGDWNAYLDFNGRVQDLAFSMNDLVPVNRPVSGPVISNLGVENYPLAWRALDIQRGDVDWRWGQQSGQALLNGESVMFDYQMPIGEIVVGGQLESNESLDGAKKKRQAVLPGAVSGLLRSIQRGATYVNYQRPYFSGNHYVFADLLAYAPGMNTSLADVAAVRQAEAKADKPPRLGSIDDGARKLIERARRPQWESVHFDVQTEFAGDVAIRHNYAGRFVIERRISGLKEEIVCNGESLWHLYQELGVGARRNMCRAYRQAYGNVVPWTIPSAEDLALGADVRLADKNTIALVPLATREKGKPQSAEDAPHRLALHLVFDPQSGRLAERRLFDETDHKTLLSVHYSPAGEVTIVDVQGKQVGKQTLSRDECPAPSLTPKTDELVILPLPYRTAQHVFKSLKRPNNGDFSDWSQQDALALLAANLTQDTTGMQRLIGQRFFARGDRRIGFYTLLLSSGSSWPKSQQLRVGGETRVVTYDPLADHPRSPLAKYAADVLESYQSGQQRASEKILGPESSFIVQLAEFHRLWSEWNSGRANSQGEPHRRQIERQTANYLSTCPHPDWAWSLMAAELNYGNNRTYESIEQLLPRFHDVPHLAYVSRYERARVLRYLGRNQESAGQFADAYETAFKAGLLPPIDGDFRAAMQSSNDGGKNWTEFIRQTSTHLLDKHQPTAVVYLAMQCQQAGDAAMGEELLSAALAQPKRPSDNPWIYLWAVKYFWQAGQLPRADTLVASMLDDKQLSDEPALWGLASWIAGQNGKLALSLSRQERALEIEFENLPEMINLQAVRQQYGSLLAQYQRLADAIATLESEPPEGFVERIVVAADRWRYLDEDDTQASQAAAGVLTSLGRRELAWDYLTTPLAEKPNEAAPWLSMGQNLRQRGELTLAVKAYGLAYEAEPTNARILWDEAQLLMQMGRRDDARRLHQQLARGDWQPRFRWIKQQARRALGQVGP